MDQAEDAREALEGLRERTTLQRLEQQEHQIWKDKSETYLKEAQKKTAYEPRMGSAQTSTTVHQELTCICQCKRQQLITPLGAHWAASGRGHRHQYIGTSARREAEEHLQHSNTRPPRRTGEGRRPEEPPPRGGCGSSAQACRYSGDYRPNIGLSSLGSIGLRGGYQGTKSEEACQDKTRQEPYPPSFPEKKPDFLSNLVAVSNI